MPAVRHLANRLVDAGFVVACPSYRQLLRGGAVKAAVEDIRSMFHWWQDHAQDYGCSPARTIIGGASAGCATSLIALQDAPLPERFLAIYGPLDFDRLPFMRPGIRSRILLGGPTRDRWSVPSPMDLEPLPVPMLMQHGKKDGLIPYDVTLKYAAKRESAGLQTTVHLYDDTIHGFYTWPDRAPFDAATAHVLEFLAE